MIIIRLLKLFIFISLLSSIIYSQELFLCESYTENGTPVGVINSLEMKPYGTAVYVLLDNKKEFKDPILYLFVDKLQDGKFTPYESKTISPKKTDTWVVTNYEFKEKGIYEIYVLNSSQNRIATNKIEVVLSEHSSNKFSTSTSVYLGESQLTFCELVVDGKPVNKFNSLSLSRSGGETFIYINNHVPLGIERIILQVWKRSEKQSNYEKLVDTKKFKILPEWIDTFFKYNFTSTGEYKIDILDKNDNFITSNIIEISN
ncbi:MAG: hypothetical protein H6612_04660 [Ignavibacteriales bacterium]|nr:hypothetical protein [Ignavibacteriales bacterium]